MHTVPGLRGMQKKKKNSHPGEMTLINFKKGGNISAAKPGQVNVAGLTDSRENWGLT